VSNFDEKVVGRLNRLGREVERLQVKERPIVITDHGALSGLGDNDHPQYLLTTGKAADSDKLDGNDSTAFVKVSALGVWTAYTPTWSAPTTNPSIGNGTLAGRYTQIGKSVIYSIALVMGSTTTYGSGNWWFSLPKLVANSSVRYIGQWRAYDASTGASYSGVTSLSSGDSGIVIFSRDQGSSTLSKVVPFTWASGDELFVTIVYETA